MQLVLQIFDVSCELCKYTGCLNNTLLISFGVSIALCTNNYSIVSTLQNLFPLCGGISVSYFNYNEQHKIYGHMGSELFIYRVLNFLYALFDFF